MCIHAPHFPRHSMESPLLDGTSSGAVLEIWHCADRVERRRRVLSTATVHRPASCWPMYRSQCCTLQARGLLKPGTRRWRAQALVCRRAPTVDASGLDHQSSSFERRATEPCARCERRPCWPQQLCCRKMLCDCSRGDPKHDCICTKAYKPSTVSGLRGVRPYFQHTFRRRTSSEAYTAISTGFSTRC